MVLNILTLKLIKINSYTITPIMTPYLLFKVNKLFKLFILKISKSLLNY